MKPSKLCQRFTESIDKISLSTKEKPKPCNKPIIASGWSGQTDFLYVPTKDKKGKTKPKSSHAGVRPKGASIPYAASKASLNHMTQLLALTLSPEIRVNAIAPGLVNTPMAESWVEAQKLWTERSPMKRGAEPLEIAHTASMLVSSSYLTGEIILSDGGLNLT